MRGRHFFNLRFMLGFGRFLVNHCASIVPSVSSGNLPENNYQNRPISKMKPSRDIRAETINEILNLSVFRLCLITFIAIPTIQIRKFTNSSTFPKMTPDSNVIIEVRTVWYEPFEEYDIWNIIKAIPKINQETMLTVCIIFTMRSGPRLLFFVDFICTPQKKNIIIFLQLSCSWASPIFADTSLSNFL